MTNKQETGRWHGGDVLGYEKEYGRRPLDFSANVSPLGMPQSVREAVLAALDGIDHYPDPFCRDLREAIAAYHTREAEAITPASGRIPPEWVFCGNGAADVIDRIVLALAPKRAMITAPTFSEYGIALRRCGCAIEEYALAGPCDREEAACFGLGEDVIDRINPDLDLLFLCEPNNPTGITSPQPVLKKILGACKENGVMVVVDESFVPLLDEPIKHTLIHCLSAYPLLLLKSFTKEYGMAGIRLGYCLCADPSLLSRMAMAGQPWAVSSLAQAAGIAALGDRAYRAALRQMVGTERSRLREALAGCGCRRIMGEANYLLFWHERTDLAGKLKEAGILIRTCTDYSGLDAHWYRVAVRRPEENAALICAMAAL